jgi:enoyl-CoA hydratase
MDYQYIIVEKKNHIAWLTLNRPQKRNAMSRALLREFDAALQDLRKDEETRVLVIKGAGKAFSSGYDLTDPEKEDHSKMTTTEIMFEERESGLRSMSRLFGILDMPQAVIAQVHGYCLAGGCEIAMNSDITIAAEDAVIGYPVSRMGASPRHIWPFLIGMKRTKELLFTGDSVSGKEADRIGMINRAVPADKLEEEVNKLAAKIAEMPLALIKLHKATVNRSFEMMGMRNAVNYALELHAFGHITDTRDTFDTMVKEKGLKTALEARDKPFGAGASAPER